MSAASGPMAFAGFGADFDDATLAATAQQNEGGLLDQDLRRLQGISQVRQLRACAAAGEWVDPKYAAL